jgi:tripartite-type tricarboxylate transporter receptor subunit TctC
MLRQTRPRTVRQNTEGDPMAITRRRFLELGTAGAVLSISRAPAFAQQFPTKPVSVICPWPPGGSTDMTMRAMAEAATKHLGQPVVIENKPGGSGTVGPATMAAAARPDGYTLSQIPISVFRMPYIMKATWDPMKDFSYVIHTTGYTFGVVVKADSPWKTWQEFLAYAKANPGKVTYATPGSGTSLHLTMETVAKQQGIKWTQVPMKGGAETTPAVLGGHVTATADSTGWAPQVDAGALRLLCTWGNQRTKRWPNVPTLKELGHGIVSNSPFGFAGPKGMDPKIVKHLHDVFRKALEEPVYTKALERYDMEPHYLGTEEYVKYAKELYETAKMEIEAAGLKKS